MSSQKSSFVVDKLDGCRLELDYLPCLNYSMQHNHYDSLISCILINDGNSEWSDLDIELCGKMLVRSKVHIDTLPQKCNLEIDGLSIKADPSELLQFTESVESRFSITIKRGEELLFEQDFMIWLMAYDQWSGLSMRPELLASFITPNYPLLSQVSIDAAKFLEKWTGSSSLDEYQTNDPNRVRSQVAAVYEALRSRGLVYIDPPASFEKYGQRIRMADKVLSEKLGTCVDLSVLFASCLEQVGINPILILTRSHCFVGAWLVNDSYNKPVGDDASFLLKNTSDGINEMVVLEATCLANSSGVSFEDAVKIGLMHLNKDEDFECFIDVYSARVNGIRPLPMRIQKDGEWCVENEGVVHENATREVKKYDRFDLSGYDKSGREVTKFMIWERKLLDFTLRNNLLDMKFGRRIIPLVSFSVDEVEDHFQDGKSFSVLPFPLLEAAETSNGGIFSSSNYPQLEDCVINGLSRGTLYSFRNETDLKNLLKYVYRTSRTSMEENGANNLFLVIGVLKWFETDTATKPRHAPILLLPIEIVRRGGALGYIIRARDEDISLNITLVELLKQQHDVDLSCLDELPVDEHGVDVKLIFSIIRERVKSKSGWNVFDETMIGIFSFNKFVMWHDIHTNSEKIKENPIIASLVEGKLQLEDTVGETDARELDRMKKPEDYILPVDVDSSQLEAVIDSGEGRSFILFGPPGTGKSQTITNMIANALYKGKRVLFVAEKMAALSVVQSRLEKIGLAPFCLELHSNKATKSHFLKQMDDAINIVHPKSQEEYSKISDELFEQRSRIMGYVDSLHKKREGQLSLYDCITSYLSLDCEMIDVDPDNLSEITKDKIALLSEKISGLDTLFKVSGNPALSKIKFLDIRDGSSESEQILTEQIKLSIKLLEQWKDIREAFHDAWGFDIAETKEGIGWAVELLECLEGLSFFSPELFRLAIDGRRLQRVCDAVDAGLEKEKTTKELVSKYTPEVMNADPKAIEQEWGEVDAKWCLPKIFAKKAFFKKMSVYKTGFDESDLHYLVTALKKCEENGQVLEGMYDEIGSLFGMLGYYGKEQWQEMKDIADKMPRILRLIVSLAEMLNISNDESADLLAKAVKGTWTSFVKDRRELLSSFTDLGEKINESLDKIYTVASIDLPKADWSGELLDAMRVLRDNEGKFVSWFLWCKERRELERLGLSNVMKYILDEGVTGSEASDSFLKGLYYKLARKIINSDDELRFFQGAIFENTIDKYRSLTSEFKELSKKELFYRLASNIPSMTMAAHNSSEVGVLKRNIKSNGRGTSIRKLIDQIPNLLPKLCPCMLMSPISVAQYIDLDSDKFDIVIFDEASQIPTSESVGAIARGKSLVVVGDPRQMPPTSFFSSSQVDEDEAHIDDMESILDDCISLSMPSKYLRWHYRSKHESLISFSNTQYYGGRLITFPSVDDQVSKVTLHPVDGVYDKGKTRSNKAEAEAIVSDVKRRLSDPELSKYSIGIVSFSKVQQNLIEDMLVDELAKYPDLENLAFNSLEPIFIKNLENVQGDERDVILFSVGYGPDKSGKVSMNFGPLNNEGGERRLNVAVSRARYEMAIFSTLRSEQIDLKRTQAVGVEGLKRFLEFAEKGTMPIASSSVSREIPSTINQKIAEMLQKNGYTVKLNVGLSQFKIDIAVVNPEKPTEYLLGILCDGSNYFATKTVRDREVVQPTVLRLLNWNLMHIWTLDWFEREKEVSRSILERLDDIRKNGSSTSNQVKAPNVIKSAAVVDNSDPTEVVPQETLVNPLQKDYVFAEIAPLFNCDDIDEITYSYYQEAKKYISQLVDIEQPITTGLVYKKAVKQWGLSRVTNRVQAFIDQLISDNSIILTDNGDNGYTCWIDKSCVSGYDEYRINSDRDILDIPYIEIRNAMKDALSQQIAINRDDLKRVAAQQIGFARMGRKIDTATEYVLNVLLSSGFAVLQGDNICLGDN